MPKSTNKNPRNGLVHLRFKRYVRKESKEGDQVLLFNSRLRLFSGKLKSRWTGPFEQKVFEDGHVNLFNKRREIFKANEQRLKLYHGVPQDPENTKIPLHDIST
ncbi:unnamed protein product [Rhodiola kirilowii]